MYPQHIEELVPKKVENLYQGRIRQFTDVNGQYRDLNLPKVLNRDRRRDEQTVAIEVYSVPDLKRPSFKKAIEAACWKPASIGDQFGPSWSTHWFKIQVKLPLEWADSKENAVLDFDSSSEGLVYCESGEPMVGINAEHHRREFPLPRDWYDDGWHTLYIETCCTNIQGNFSPPDENRQFRLNCADLVLPNAPARALFHDFHIIGDAGREFPGDSWQKHRALDVLNRIINTFDLENVDESVAKCREIAKEIIGPQVDSEQVYRNPTPRFTSSNFTDSKSNLVYGIGNCHIDTAWLWPYAETRRKIVRSWTSQLDLIEKYPEYRFVASQAIQFAWLEEDHPAVFEQLKRAIKTGHFGTIGGAWVECDTNMPSGEALARQMILGQHFFMKHFNKRSRVFWLPDTFGYSPQLPQICREAGMDRFLTQKLSWNNINSFPHSTFNWVGIDGSQLLCHMPPANTYTAEANFGDVKRTISQHKNLDVDQHGLLLFGYGDGGGGPTTDMLERLRRCRGLSDTVGLLPRVMLGPSVDDYFDELEKATQNGKTLPSWVGELYLEFHRGTYTTQAQVKQKNRLAEVLMHDIETMGTFASLKSPSTYRYPFEEINKIWQLVCQNQFHDVLPGSSIGVVYEEAHEIYDTVFKEGKKLLENALAVFGCKPSGPTSINTLLWPRAQVAPVECVQESKLKNGHLTVTFKDGVISKIKDKNGRQVLVPNTLSNQLVLFEDQPMSWPAWDTEQYATEKFKVLKPATVSLQNNVHVASYKFGKSSATVKTWLENQKVIFSVDVDWHETYQFLKAEFHPDIVSDFASYETAFGIQRRPTHYNTSWDAAKFEVCGHKFADLSEHNYGVALLSDSKYGYSIHGKTMRLSLLRSAKNPDQNADMGTHSFRYALMPHSGPLGADVVRAAYELNYRALPYSPASDLVFPIKMTGDPSAILSNVKRAESDVAATATKLQRVILRIYESLGGQARAVIHSSINLRRAFRVNLLEEEIAELDVISTPNDEQVEIILKPFEICSIRLDLEPSGKQC